ncbi:MAG: DUF2807 domain-containing protein [Candidatus Marinimicrobia bacterium]|nr:DUF2807 domain-containing protein [Candidatus Neomarinimicrobiota bacterium]
MKKSLLLIIYVTLLLPMLLGSIAWGQVIKEERSVIGFDRVNLKGSGKVILTQGNSEALTVEAEKDLLLDIKTEVRGRTLYLEVKDRYWRKAHWWSSKNRIKYYITMKTVRGFSVSGSGTIISEKIETDELKISISGSGEIGIESLQAQDLNIRISGSGDCHLAGEVDSQDISISGSGSYAGEYLRSDETTARISGSGNATVWVEKGIDVQISGSGKVEYRGNPEAVSFQSSGSGKVRKIDGGLE